MHRMPSQGLIQPQRSNKPKKRSRAYQNPVRPEPVEGWAGF